MPQVRPSHQPASARLDLTTPRRGKPPVHFADLSPAERGAIVVEKGQPKFRAKQLEAHYFGRLTTDSAQWTDIPAAAREPLHQALFPNLLTELMVRRGDNGTTAKTLWELADKCRIETVLMRYPSRTTLCLSTQVGCGMACPFCATGQMGLTRNLSAAEMLEQVRTGMIAAQTGQLMGGSTRLSNLVFMGMGEGLANYRALLIAIRAIIAPQPSGFGISARNLTVSTVGLVPGIKKLAAESLPLKLALSLHAPDDDLRDELVPINTKWPIAEALNAAREYFEATGRRVSIEYALVKNMNDQPWRADLLARKLKSRGHGWAHVNPIPLNPTPGSIWTASSKPVMAEFVERLRAAGIPTTIRDTRGSDIDGACGQLAAQEPY